MPETAIISIGSLWLPILVSAGLVWVASAVMWMVLPHHRSDYLPLPDEGPVRDALGGQDLAPNQAYTVPGAASREDRDDPEFQRRMEEGPVAFVRMQEPGPPNMGKQLSLHLIYCLAVGAVVAYVAGRTLAPGTAYLDVFQITGTVAWVAYGWAFPVAAIWFGWSWSEVTRHLLDALVYGLLTAGAFGWLWPA